MPPDLRRVRLAAAIKILAEHKAGEILRKMRESGKRRGGSSRLKVLGVADARFEIWFPSPDEVSVWLETDLEAEPGIKREVLETWVFAALAAGVIANLPKPLAKALCARLEEFPDTTSDEDVPAVVDGFHIVLPRPERRRKGFEGSFTVTGDVPISRLKPRGFRLFGREVQEYAQTATMAVLHDLFHGLTRGSRVMLVQTAHALGDLGQLGAIRMTTHGHAANTALDRGIEAAEAAEGARGGIGASMESLEDFARLEQSCLEDGLLHSANPS